MEKKLSAIAKMHEANISKKKKMKKKEDKELPEEESDESSEDQKLEADMGLEKHAKKKKK
jgi:hypothetical protein